jgi:hypothetical protein
MVHNMKNKKKTRNCWADVSDLFISNKTATDLENNKFVHHYHHHPAMH